MCVVLGMPLTACSVLTRFDGLNGTDAGVTSATDASTLLDGTSAVSDAGAEARARPDGAVTFAKNGHDYLAVAGPPTDWSGARAAAQAMGGHLVTITDNEENEFVIALINTQRSTLVRTFYGPWMGGYQPSPTPEQEPDGGWQWIDGTPWSFVGWIEPPSNTNGNENYLHYLDSTGAGGAIEWNDIDVNGSNNRVISYIVEFD